MIKTLYKKNKDKVQQWSIEIEDNKYRSVEGFVGGAMTTSQWTTVGGKNIGRSNETTPEEQAVLEGEAKYTLKLNKGYTANPTGETVMRFEPMLAHKYKDRVDKINWDEDLVYSQPKLDGIRCNISINGAVTRTGKPIVAVPHILKALEPFFAKYPTVILDGELYNHLLKEDFNSIVSHVRKSKPTEEDLRECEKVIEYHVYDLYDTADASLSLCNRIDYIFEIFSTIKNANIIRVDTLEVDSEEDLDSLYASYREQGYEGQMIRLNTPYEQKRSYNLLKRKEFQDSEFEILDIIEGIGNRSGMMGKFILTTGKEQFEANSLGNYEYYTKLLKDKKKYIGKKATVRYQNLTPRGVPRFGCVHSIRDFE